MEDGEIVELAAADRRPPPPPKVEKSPYEMLKETKSSVEEIVSQILSMKNGSTPKSNLRELVSKMFLHFVTLRQANRTILLEEDRVKAETESAKAPVDFRTLQLHNLMYEKSHYVKAIKACKDFKSKYPDIELVPEEEFIRDAPEHIKGPALSDNTSHSLMLKRLNFELHQRKELCKLHEKLELRKKSLLESIANRKKFLTSIPSHLKSIKKASLPLQNQLGVSHTKKMKQQSSAELLPPPLYVIYSQLMAQKEAFGENIDVEMVGSLKEAQSFVRLQANKDSGLSTNSENSRIEDDMPDEEDDGQRRRKRPKKVPSKESLDDAGLYQAHPLNILLHVYDDENIDPKFKRMISLKFEYMLKLNVVCVDIEGSNEGPENNILCNLFPDDTGLELPHQSAKLFVGDAAAFDTKRTSRPYKWAQHLAGIDFLPEIPPLLNVHAPQSNEMAKSDVASGLSQCRQQNRVQTVLQKLRSRKRAQLALEEQLDCLMKFKWPSLNGKNIRWTSHTPLCNLVGWSATASLTSEAASISVSDPEQAQESIDYGMEGRYVPSKEEYEGAREDGELPSLMPVGFVVNGVSNVASKVSNIQHSRELSLISKSIISPINRNKSLSFKRQDEDADLLLDSASDHEDFPQMEMVEAISSHGHGINKMLWADHWVKEYNLVLTRKINGDRKNVKLEAKVKISMEYPIRPPHFTVALFAIGEDHDETYGSEWYNELRAMEAEVNLHILKMIPYSEENYILAHQVHCLAMLFDILVNGLSPSEKSDGTSVVDVGLCKPVSGNLIARSFRRRDRRRMFCWNDLGSKPL